ncbi:hypothetical protein PVL29_005125 [Vitis rotundifolia]|uniref:Fe2OG dioxygenase domain-containing protein n=1 Tax=Vitis rotundifolia TaxID=103349 RepID=A0AA39AA23_VITRO|nr:hypothetical protein PVL29_005125 [Vitis rotundifolia]
MSDPPVETLDSFLRGYQRSELRIASEFLTTWLPFLSRDLCHHCAETLSDRIRSIGPEVHGDAENSPKDENVNVSTPDIMQLKKHIDSHCDNCDSNSLGSWKDDGADTNSVGSFKDEATEWSEPVPEASTSELASESPLIETPSPRISWADMAQEDELEEEEEHEANKRSIDENSSTGEVGVSKVPRKAELPREQREYIRFRNVQRKKDFICLERVKGKLVNILDGLELHVGIFSAAEQKRIVDFIYELQEMGRNGQLKERTYSAPQKWMRGKGRVTIQFGCCYNYATDKNGNPPGILQNEVVDPIPPLFKVIIRRLVRWHVLPPSCVPDSCIVNIYEEGDCIPPHIDNHDFVRPFCTVSFLSECNIVFGTNLKILGAGEFAGPFPIPLPVGSVLVLNGNGADVAKHCVPAVPSKRISITFRKMDESKRPIGYLPEPDLQGLQPVSYEMDRSKISNPQKPERRMNRQAVRREGSVEARGFMERGDHSGSHYSSRAPRGPANRRRIRENLAD